VTLMLSWRLPCCQAGFHLSADEGRSCLARKKPGIPAGAGRCQSTRSRSLAETRRASRWARETCWGAAVRALLRWARAWQPLSGRSLAVTIMRAPWSDGKRGYPAVTGPGTRGKGGKTRCVHADTFAGRHRSAGVLSWRPHLSRHP